MEDSTNKWNEYLKNFKGDEQNDSKEIIKLFVSFLEELYQDQKSNDFRSIEIEGWNDYNGYSIGVYYDTLYYQNYKRFCISYSEEHIAAYPADACFIRKEYVYINLHHQHTMYKKVLSSIKKIVLGKAGLLNE